MSDDEKRIVDKLKNVSPNTLTFVLSGVRARAAFIGFFKVEPLYQIKHAFLGLCCLNMMILSQVLEALERVKNHVQ